MAKCVLLVRVSTTSKKQELSLDEQGKELKTMAYADGYTDDDIILIANQESGLKRFYAKTDDEKDLQEIQRQGLQDLENAIKNDSSINCVYVWEISRISRRETVLFWVLEMLIDRKIQLIVKSPSIKLLLPNGEVDTMQKTMFTMFTALSAAEMSNKLARFKRTKESKRSEGKFVGGWVVFGYDVDPDTKKFIINEKEAEIVKFIFTEYLNGNYSIYGLADELQARGIIDYRLRSSAKTFVSIILHNYAYAGLPSSVRQKGRKTSGNIYPAIVTKEMVDAAIAKAEKAISYPKTTNNIYYGKGIIICGDCGRKYIARKSAACYHCGGQVNHCRSKQVKINIMDSLLWFVGWQLKTTLMMFEGQEAKERYNKQLAAYKEKVAKLEKDIETAKGGYKRINDIYKKGRYTEEEYDAEAKDLDKEIDGLHKEKETIITKMFELERIINNLNASSEINVADIAQIQDDKARYDIIHEVIDRAVLNSVADGVLKIDIYDKFDAESEAQTFYITTRNRKIYNGDFKIEQAYNFDDTCRIPIKILDRYQCKMRESKEKAKERIKKYYLANREEIIKRNTDRKKRKKEALKNTNN